MMDFQSVWIVTKPAADFQATLHLLRNPPGVLDPTPVVLTAPLLATLVAQMPQGRRRMPRFPSQAAAVIENWV